MSVKQWVYRPSEEEQRAFKRVLDAHPEFPSAAQFIREATHRLMYSDNISTRFIELEEVLEELYDLLGKLKELTS